MADAITGNKILFGLVKSEIVRGETHWVLLRRDQFALFVSIRRALRKVSVLRGHVFCFGGVMENVLRFRVFCK
jgi:hypothetical protein